MPRPLPSGAEIGARYKAGTAGGTQRFKDGVGRVTDSPTAKAATRLDVAKQNFSAAVDSGRMAAGLNRVSLEQWKNMTQVKGGNNYATGAAAAVPKIVAYYAQRGPAIADILGRIRNMPSGTYEERQAKARAWSDAMHELAQQPR